MARGSWARASIPAMRAAGADIEADPYGLFDGEKKGDVLPYDDDAYAAMCAGVIPNG